MGYVENALRLHDKLSDLVVDQSKWSQETFGSDQERGPVGALKHLEKEAREAYEAAQNAGNLGEELADCFLLLLDAMRRSGLKLEGLVDLAKQKMVRNKLRKWPKPTDKFTPVEHERE